MPSYLVAEEWTVSANVDVLFMGVIEEVACNDVCQYQNLFNEWNLSVTQLSRGKFGFREERFKLPGMTLTWFTFQVANEAIEFYLRPGVAISFILDCENFYRFNGRELRPGSAFLQRRGEECSFAVGGRATVLELQMSDEVLDDLNWSPPSSRTCDVDREQLLGLARQAAEMAGATHLPGPETIAASQASLIGQLGEMLHADGMARKRPKFHPASTPAGYEIVRRADAWFAQLRVKRPVRGRELSQALQIPERSLFRAFKNWVGVGPSHYFKLKRLHAVRRELRGREVRANQISEIAELYGFTNPGRMSKQYCELFNEYPSGTLRRAGHRQPLSA